MQASSATKKVSSKVETHFFIKTEQSPRDEDASDSGKNEDTDGRYQMLKKYVNDQLNVLKHNQSKESLNLKTEIDEQITGIHAQVLKE